jgi:hypothetical protein
VLVAELYTQGVFLSLLGFSEATPLIPDRSNKSPSETRRHCERREAIQFLSPLLDCFVATSRLRGYVEPANGGRAAFDVNAALGSLLAMTSWVTSRRPRDLVSMDQSFQKIAHMDLV